MQLDRLVTFYKAMADPTRIRILAILANGPLHGQALAGKLGITPPTITHHMAKLREAGLVYERREKNTIYFFLHEVNLKRSSQAIHHLLEHAKNGAGAEQFEEGGQAEAKKEEANRHL